MILLPPICIDCKHFDFETYTCTAFPNEIPLDILDGIIGHSKPLPNQDNNIVFEPKEKKDSFKS